MRISIFRHNCAMWGYISKTNDNCPFYWKMPGGNSYHGNVYFFTLFGIRIIINTTSYVVKKKDLCI